MYVLLVDGRLALYGTVRAEIRFCKVETRWTLLVFADEKMATSHDGVGDVWSLFVFFILFSSTHPD